MPAPAPWAGATSERLEHLLKASLLFASELSLEGVLQKVADLALDIIGARYAAIGVIAPDGRVLESFTTAGLTPEERARIGAPPKGHGILGLLIREARPIRLPDLTRHPDSYGFPPHHPPMYTFLGVPITGRRGVFGNLYLTEKLGGGHFTDEDEYIALLLAAQAAAAVEHARLHEESARLIEEIQQLHRARERFFAMVNHEMRNALAGVYGWAEMLVRKKDPATVPRAAFEVLDSANQAIALINDLLDLSRLDEDRLQPRNEAVVPDRLVRRVIARMTPAAEAKQIRLEPALAAELPRAETDPHRVEQILVNLLTNAIRYAPADSAVRLEVMAEDGQIYFRVRDDGPGVPAADRERIFDIYMTKGTGEDRTAGLGLPLSRRLARLLKGDLWIEDPGDRPGASFVLRLPALIAGTDVYGASPGESPAR